MSQNSHTPFDANRVNLNKNERLVSLGAGALLLLYALIRLPVMAVLAMLAAVYMVFFRGVRGYCFLYDVLGINTAVEKSSGRHSAAQTAVPGSASTHFAEAD